MQMVKNSQSVTQNYTTFPTKQTERANSQNRVLWPHNTTATIENRKIESSKKSMQFNQNQYLSSAMT